MKDLNKIFNNILELTNKFYNIFINGLGKKEEEKKRQ